MTFEEQNIKGIYKITLEPITDNRGWFARVFCENQFKGAGIHFKCLQVNHSFTKEKGTFRGIHFQFGNYAEYKLIRCISGSVLDFGVDLRKDSETLFCHYSLELNSENNTMLLLSPGIGHAFQTLQGNSTLNYFHSANYNPLFEGGIRFDDPKINLKLPLKIKNLSERDKTHPFLNDKFTGLEI